MPELPDVASFKQYLDATALHQTIESVTVETDQILEDVSPDRFEKTLTGQLMVSSHRYGKYLLVELARQQRWLSLHFGMTGHLKYYKNLDETPKYTKLRLDFENGYHLAFVNPRKLGRVGLLDNPTDFIEAQNLGPDVMADDFDFEAFVSRLSGRRGMIKSALMNQEIMSGIGNEYSDEILFQARIHPKTQVNQLDEERLKEIFVALKDALQTAIDHNADWKQLPDSFLLPHRSEGVPCPNNCGGTVQKITVSGRSGYYCPTCQPKL